MDNLRHELHIRIDEETLRRIDDLAQELGLKRSQLVRLIIRSFMRNMDEMIRVLMVEGYGE